MPEPHMPHGWIHALVRYTDAPAGPASDRYGTVVDELENKVRVRWSDGSRTWDLKRDLWPWVADQPD